MRCLLPLNCILPSSCLVYDGPLRMKWCPENSRLAAGFFLPKTRQAACRALPIVTVISETVIASYVPFPFYAFTESYELPQPCLTGSAWPSTMKNQLNNLNNWSFWTHSLLKLHMIAKKGFVPTNYLSPRSCHLNYFWRSTISDGFFLLLHNRHLRLG